MSCSLISDNVSNLEDYAKDDSLTVNDTMYFENCLRDSLSHACRLIEDQRFEEAKRFLTSLKPQFEIALEDVSLASAMRTLLERRLSGGCAKEALWFSDLQLNLFALCKKLPFISGSLLLTLLFPNIMEQQYLHSYLKQ